MFCPNCGKQISDDSKFCLSCGKSLTASASTQLAKEVCTIEFTGEKPGCLYDIMSVIPFVSFIEPSITCWYEAQIADKPIAKSPTFQGRYSSPHYAGANKAVLKTFIDDLQAEGWEPIVDPRSGTINSMQRTITRS